MTRRPGSGVQAYRRRAADTERMIDAAVAEVKAARDADWEAQKVAAQQARERHEANPPDLSALKPGSMIRTRYGWRQVVKVNTKTVRVATGYSWTDLVKHAHILEVRNDHAL